MGFSLGATVQDVVALVPGAGVLPGLRVREQKQDHLTIIFMRKRDNLTESTRHNPSGALESATLDAFLC